MSDRPQKITFADTRDLAAIFSRDAIWSPISTTANIGATEVDPERGTMDRRS